jgi:hypothetical protein
MDNIPSTVSETSLDFAGVKHKFKQAKDSVKQGGLRVLQGFNSTVENLQDIAWRQHRMDTTKDYLQHESSSVSNFFSGF